MKQVRKVHFWLGAFFAPSIVFFAFSGAMQILGLHEGSGAMGWVTKLSQIHKDQSIGSTERRARPPGPAAAPVDPPRARPGAEADVPPAGGPRAGAPLREGRA